MKRPSFGTAPRQFRWSRLARRLVATLCIVSGVDNALAQRAVTTLAGAAGVPGSASATAVTGTDARFNFATPSGAVIDAGGNVYVADTVNHVIRKITSAGIVTIFAGSAGVIGSADGTGAAAGFYAPQGLAIDGLGNLYVADTGNHAIRMITPSGLVSTVAGTAGGVTPLPGYVNAIGTAARFRSPVGVAADRAGAGGGARYLFVADTQNNAIRRIDVSTRSVVTHAGGVPNFGLPATPGNVEGTYNGVDAINLAAFNLPTAIVSDITGFSVYVADSGNHVIRRIVFDTINTSTSRIAGTGTPGYLEGFSTGAAFNNPTGLALDASSSTLIVADTFNQVVRSVTTSGVTSLIAGAPGAPGSADGLAVITARFNRPTGVATDVVGNIFVVDTLNATVRRVSSALAPIISVHPVAQTASLGSTVTFTAAATGTPSPTYQWQRFRMGDTSFVSLAEGAPYTGTQTGTLTITPVGAEMAGDLYQLVANNGVASVATVAAQLSVNLGPIYTTWAGLAGSPGVLDGVGATARFRSPMNMGQDTAGNVYVADTGNHVIRKISPSGVVTTLAGTPGVPGATEGLSASARFNSPSGVAVDLQGNVYVADTGNHTIRIITPSGVVGTFAGLAGNLGSADGAGSNARFQFPSAIVSDSTGALYVADTLNHTIRKIVAGTVSTLAGTAGTQGSLDGSGISARFAFPSGIAVDAAFTVYVADTVNHVIRMITAAGVVTTPAGLANVSGSADGAGNIARFNQPKAVAVDGTTIYIADSGNHTIRSMTVAAGVGTVTTVAGVAGSSGTADGALNLARFNSPSGVIASGGVVTVADTQNHTIRRTGAGTAAGIVQQPQNQVAALGGTVSFTVTVTGSPTPVFQWQRRAAGTSDFISLANDATYSGATTPTLTISSINAGMAGDEFRVLLNNLVTPAFLSDVASLSIATPPVITSANNATFRIGQNNAFTVTATSTPAAQFTATGLPSWVTLDPVSGVLSGTPTSTSGSPFTIVITANPGTGASTATTQTFTLTVEPEQAAPTITSHPASVTVNRGENATFSVTASGSSPLSYQWRRNGAAINGATSTTLVVPNAQAASAGAYSVTVSNAFGNVTSNPATLAVNTAPVIAAQPRSQTVLAGGSVTLSADVSGASGITYQWRRNGVAIPGATGATHTVTNASAAEAGNYDVVITNPLGSVTSSIAQLNVVSGPSAPVFTLHPASRTTTLGGAVTLAVAATGVPAPTYQWRRNGVALAGATGASYSIANAQPGDAGTYDVVATSSAGTATSLAGTVRIIARSYAGIYFGTFAGNLGTFAIYVRGDNTGMFLGYLPGSTAPVVNLGLSVNDAGQFSFSQGAVATAATREGEPARAAALAAVTVNGMLGADGSVTGSITGGANASLSGNRVADTGTTQGVAGYYQAGAPNSGAVAHVIASADGRAFVLAQTGAASDGGTGTVGAGGQVAISTGRSSVTGTIQPANGTISLAAAGAVAGTYTGASESVLAVQRLLNISSRARVAGGDTVAIAGFVISGNESKPVLIRAVGPSLGLAPFNLTGVLSNPKLDLHRLGAGGSAELVATSTGIAGNRVGIDAAGAHIGAFALGAAGNDSAILTTLSPGNYTATVSSATTNTGVALIEVYDLSAATAGQKLLNISTRASAGSAENTLIAGVVVSGVAPKRVLIRAVGPGLAVFGVSGVLAQPTLTLYDQGGQPVALNTGWTNSADAAAITSASAQVGAFPLASGDSAIVVSLPSGNYTAQVTAPGTATGVALVELYELP